MINSVFCGFPHCRKRTLSNIKTAGKTYQQIHSYFFFETEFHIAQGNPNPAMKLRSLTNGMTISFRPSLFSLLITFSQHLRSVGKLHLNLSDDFPGLILINDDNLINQSQLWSIKSAKSTVAFSSFSSCVFFFLPLIFTLSTRTTKGLI